MRYDPINPHFPELTAEEAGVLRGGDTERCRVCASAADEPCDATALDHCPRHTPAVKATKPVSEMTQVGGSHYQHLPIQPRQFAMKNEWDSDSFSILKYLTRYPDKAGIEDVKKARYFAVMRKEWAPPPKPFRAGDIAMLTYVHENELSPMVGNALMSLDQWVRRGAHDKMSEPFPDRTIAQIDAIIYWLESNS